MHIPTYTHTHTHTYLSPISLSLSLSIYIYMYMIYIYRIYIYMYKISLSIYLYLHAIGSVFWKNHKINNTKGIRQSPNQGTSNTYTAQFQICYGTVTSMCLPFVCFWMWLSILSIILCLSHYGLFMGKSEVTRLLCSATSRRTWPLFEDPHLRNFISTWTQSSNS